MIVELWTTAIFNDLAGYFFENLRDKASRYGDMLPLVGCNAK